MKNRKPIETKELNQITGGKAVGIPDPPAGFLWLPLKRDDEEAEETIEK